jgi:hypothetical protein
MNQNYYIVHIYRVTSGNIARWLFLMFFKYQYTTMQFLNHATLVQEYIFISINEVILNSNKIFW